MAQTRRKFDAEFHEGAVRIVTETGKTATEVAGDLGINPGTLQNWVNKARRQAEPAGGPLSESEREEPARLRAADKEKSKKIMELEMEREVLKRCMVLWVK
ncbi:transposase [Streptomyces sp. A3M-1-3]|uniref:transposase n=1 Tax=Streptomyces sp. A3M-1-3 TaxID=2962044 RepID=UPI0020B6F165|nr:transposase [Streptomyces sp. A3M-1-3]MCP3820340.1 transposase [Streptomyces sp. A3M-1-3]